MENHEYKILSEDSIKYLCGLIRDLASVSEGIDNINLADDKTFSNIYIKNLIDKCLEDANTEAEKLVGALTHLTCEETVIQPTLDNSEINVIYLYSANGNPPYQQFLKISENKLVDLGSTSISLEDYIKVADVAKDYATKVELKAVTDKIGTTTLTTTDITITGAIEEVKGIAEGKADKSEIPITLPANGGNADTVNNHTVKSDVPENAKFTDTIYDDTEVKGSIKELNNNLNKPAHGFDISFIENGVLVEKRVAQYQKIGNIVFVSMLFKYTTNNLYSRIQLPVIPSGVASWGMQAQYNDIIGYVEYDYFVLRTPEKLWNTEIDFGCGFFYFYDIDTV